MFNDSTPGWIRNDSVEAMRVLKIARDSGRPVVLLTGGGISVDSGFPLASQLKEYLVQVREYVSRQGFSNIRQYIEEARWPSRHDLRIDLMLKIRKLNLVEEMKTAERKATQAALIAELRRDTPTLASSLREIFSMLDDNLPEQKKKELERLYKSDNSLALLLGQRSPKNIAYRSLLFNLCDNNQATIDACFDHFIRDRTPTTTHQFIYFLTRVLRTPVIFTTNFDPLLENAFVGEGLVPRVYEVQGEGSIPSARLLLSQPLSIVKLHGGAHQMQTGFDLDDPLSPSALASFRELYEGLHKTFGQPPLTVVIGYSGSDRRVMDIVSAQIHEWQLPDDNEAIGHRNNRGEIKADGGPRVLWVSRDPWEPELLKAAVMTHPAILQRGAAGGPFPAHLVRYRDGRLFLLEALQTLLRHFPIARSHYQAVNFVPHSVAGKDRSTKNAEKFDGEWRVALIHTSSGGGSSSTLVELAERLEQRADYRTVWIDLTEVAGVPALIDLISERITKLDGRLQPVRRPPLLRSLLDNQDGMDGTTFSKASREHEFRSCVQWLRHALRRDKYLLALDSLDEFPNEHPALRDKPNRKKITSADNADQLQLMCRLIKELTSFPNLIGDSRIAIALSSATESDNLSIRNVVPGPKHPFVGLARYLWVESERKPEIRVPPLDSAEFQKSDCISAFASLGNPIVGSFQSQESGRAVGVPRMSSLQATENEAMRRFIWTVVILIACCARRIRSEVLLRRCVAEYIGRIHPDTEFSDLINQEQVTVREMADGGRCVSLIPKQGKRRKTIKESFKRMWAEPQEAHQHASDKANPKHEIYILQCIHMLSGHEDPPFGVDLCVAQERRWLYRTEGAYHWMHRDIRNGLYQAIKDSGEYPVLAMAHHVIALFCYDELYERSRDARAFLEYMFHRVASIQLAIDAGQHECALHWVTRLLISLHREKHALLTRVRLPGFIRQMMQLRRVITSLKPKPPLEKEPARLMTDLLQLLSDFFLASGHPHSALSDCLTRLSFLEPKLVSGKSDHICNLEVVETITKTLQSLNIEKLPKDADERVKLLAALRDVAYSCHDPLLSVKSFPGFPVRQDAKANFQRDSITRDTAAPKITQAAKVDWIKLMMDGSENKRIVTRTSRIEMCKAIYSTIAKLRPENRHLDKKLNPWTEHDLEMDFFGGLIRKTLEFRMLCDHPETWIESSKVYLSENPHAMDELNKFCANGVSLDEKWPNNSELQGNIPLLRRTGKRQRHECYRLCLTARREAAKHLWVKSAEDVTRELLEDGRHEWDKICRLLADAESILNRSGGPADRQAMAITRLTWAELFIRRAEVIRWAYDKSSNAASKLPPLDLRKLELACEKSLDEAFATMSTVEQLMNEGRGENRWRFFYLLTRARAHLLRAFIRKDLAPLAALTDMTWAARHLSGALNNCGIWTDRYDVLLWWWDVWKEVAKIMHEEVGGFDNYLSSIYARVGIRWDIETSADRFGRIVPDER